MSEEGFLEGELEDDEDDEENNEEVDIVRAEPVDHDEQEIIKPVTDDFSEIKEIYDRFEEIKSDILTKEDRQSISGNLFITKSGWRKIATAFNISVKTVEEEAVETDDNIIRWKVKAEATAPNGVTSTGIGMAASNESNFMESLKKKSGKDETVSDVAVNHNLQLEEVVLVDGYFRRIKPPREVSDHDIIATAATRAKNRSISDLVGGGKVSSEEMTAEDFLG